MSWTIVPKGSEVWSGVSRDAESWSTVSKGSEAWVDLVFLLTEDRDFLVTETGQRIILE